MRSLHLALGLLVLADNERIVWILLGVRSGDNRIGFLSLDVLDVTVVVEAIGVFSAPLALHELLEARFLARRLRLTLRLLSRLKVEVDGGVLCGPERVRVRSRKRGSIAYLFGMTSYLRSSSIHSGETSRLWSFAFGSRAKTC